MNAITMPNKKTLASALKYESSKPGAPKVVAKGQQAIAEKIIELAKKNGILIKKDEDLANVLDLIEINEEIPLEVYSIVAEIFAFLYNMNQNK